MNKKQVMLYLASTVLSGLLFLIGLDNITRFIEGVPNQKVDVSGLQGNLKDVKIPDGDRWVEGPTSFDKNSLVVLDGYLHSTLGPAEIVSFYKKTAPSRGWVESKMASEGSDKMMKFCRHGVSLIVESGAEEREDYYIRLAWTTNEKSDSYCPRPEPDHANDRAKKR